MSKFEEYLKESSFNEKNLLFIEEVNLLLEALGHVDEVDAHDLGLPAFKDITVDDIVSAIKTLCKTGKCDVKKYLEKLNKAYKGRMSTQDKDKLISILKLPYWPTNSSQDKSKIFGNQ